MLLPLLTSNREAEFSLTFLGLVPTPGLSLSWCQRLARETQLGGDCISLTYSWYFSFPGGWTFGLSAVYEPIESCIAI